MALLRQRSSNPNLQTLISRVEQEHPADLTSSAGLLRGVWELRWSSSRQPWLKPTAGLENLQVLNPVRGRGCNLPGLQITDITRVEVRFTREAGSGPHAKPPELMLMRQVQQSSPAWLDICAGSTTADLPRQCRHNIRAAEAERAEPERIPGRMRSRKQGWNLPGT